MEIFRRLASILFSSNLFLLVSFQINSLALSEVICLQWSFCHFPPLAARRGCPPLPLPLVEVAPPRQGWHPWGRYLSLHKRFESIRPFHHCHIVPIRVHYKTFLLHHVETEKTKQISTQKRRHNGSCQHHNNIQNHLRMAGSSKCRYKFLYVPITAASLCTKYFRPSTDST